MSLEEVVKELKKSFGDNILMDLNDIANLNKDYIPTGSIGLDTKLGGGLVRGRLVEIYGGESSGKSTLTIHMMVEHQKYGKVLLVDTENSFDKFYAEKLGLDLNNFLVSQPDTAEQAFEVIETLAKSGEFSLIVLDSVAALSPRAEVEGDSGDSNMGLLARLMGQHLRKLTPIANKNKCTVVYINQIRMKIGVMWGSNETRSGGQALKYFASLILDMRVKERLKKKDEIIGIKSKIKIAKNKTNTPFQECEVHITHGNGIDTKLEIVELAIEKGIVEKKGSWFSYGDLKVQGLESLLEEVDVEQVKKEVYNEIFSR